MTASLQMPFNPAQVEILQLFSQGLTDAQTEELRRILIAFRFKLLDEQVERAAAQKGLTLEQVNSASKQHRRTPYRSKKRIGQLKDEVTKS
jgi:hypothetical protein